MIKKPKTFQKRILFSFNIKTLNIIQIIRASEITCPNLYFPKQKILLSTKPIIKNKEPTVKTNINTKLNL